MRPSCTTSLAGSVADEVPSLFKRLISDFGSWHHPVAGAVSCFLCVEIYLMRLVLIVIPT